MLPESRHVGVFKVVHRKLQLLGKAHFAIRDRSAGVWIAGPHDVVDRVHILQERGDALHAVSQFGADGVEVESAALLEVGELGDLQAIEHDLPAHAPRAARGPLPVVLFKLEVVLDQVDPNCLSDSRYSSCTLTGGGLRMS